MKTLILSFLLTTPLGCSPDASASTPVASNQQTTAPVTSESTPDASVPDETKKGGTADPSGTVNTASNEDPPKHRQNPRRLYQLDELKTVKIKIGKHTFNTWVMDSDQKRAEGMMWLENEDFTDKDAMIFVYNEPFEMSFWMRNTLVDLDIAYVASNKNIIRTVTMKRLDETGIPSKGDAQYAIEFKANLLRKLGIKPGMKVEMPELKSEDYK